MNLTYPVSMSTKLMLRPPSPAATAQAGQSLLFLREEQLRQAQELLFFAYRDFTGAADPVLEELGLGRAHHRVLYFVGARSGVTVTELLALLRITKQSLARVLGQLVTLGFVEHTRGADRRQKHLALTEAGRELERRLFTRQRELLVAAFSEAGVAAVNGFRQVLAGLTTEIVGEG